MKARSVVFTHVQWPFRVFGLPPSLVAATFGLSISSMVLTFFTGLVPVSMIVFALMSVIGLGVSFRLAGQDRHVETIAFTTLTFWRFSPRRWLLSGATPLRSEGGGP